MYAVHFVLYFVIFVKYFVYNRNKAHKMYMSAWSQVSDPTGKLSLVSWFAALWPVNNISSWTVNYQTQTEITDHFKN